MNLERMDSNPMRTAKLPHFILLLIALLAASIATAYSAPNVIFSTAIIKNVAAGATITTSPIIVQNATGVSQVDLTIPIPSGFTIDPTTAGGNLTCVTAGSSKGTLFFATKESGSIQISCMVNPDSTLQVVSSITMTAPSSWTSSSSAQINISGTITGGTGTATFGTLSILPVHSISFSAQPSLSSSAANGGDLVVCSATVADNWSGTINYTWSDGDAGGSFNNSHTQNPTYTVPANTTGANRTIIFTCTAISATDATTISATTSLLLHAGLAGDLNKDGKVDKSDADLILRKVLGDTDIISTSEWDVNADGKIDLNDATWILQHMTLAP